jgi:membrane fusion protein, multidrug efflux system
MNARSVLPWLACVLLIAAADTASSAELAPPTPKISVCKPVVGEVADYEEYFGRAEAVQRVELRARVSGYLDKIAFKEGSVVKKGDLLFEIDPRPYRAALDQAEATVKIHQAEAMLAKAALDRSRELFNKRTVAELDLIRDEGAYEVAKAKLVAAKAALTLAELQLSFTRITAPIDGRIGRVLVDAGNLVQADTTHLATIVSTGQVYIYFDVDERVLRRLVRSRPAKADAEPPLPVRVGLADDDGFPHEGKFDFIDNQVDPNTGTIRFRAVLANPNQLILPGMFARVRLMTSEPYKAFLIPATAVDTGGGFYVVNDKGIVEYLAARSPAGLHRGDLRAVKQGLTEKSRVVVDANDGLEAFNNNLTVKPRIVETGEKHPKVEPDAEKK